MKLIFSAKKIEFLFIEANLKNNEFDKMIKIQTLKIHRKQEYDFT